MQDFTPLISSLKEKYNIISCYDISVYFSKDGDKLLHELVIKSYKESFKPNDRIIFYFDKDDHSYDCKNSKLLDTLQSYITEVDISNCFIILISSDEKSSYQLDLAHKNYSLDETKIQYIQSSNIQTTYQPIPNHINKMCVAPWMHLRLDTVGNVYPCCDFQIDDALGNLQNQSLDEIINSERSKKLRKDMLDGKRISSCENCYKREENGGESLRNKKNKIWGDFLNEIDSTTPVSIKAIDIGVSNVCNFKCRMCHGLNSSKIATEEYELYGTKPDVLTFGQRQISFPQILDKLEHIENLYMSGGEPLMMPELYQVFDKLIELNKTDITLECNTNLSNLSYKGKNILDYLLKFGNLTFTLSLDGDYKYAEYIRHGTVWDDIVNNLEQIKQTSDKINLKVNSTINIYNAFNLVDFQKDWIEKGYINPKMFKINPLTLPPYLSLQVLPSEYKQLVETKINKHIEFCNSIQEDGLAKQWMNVINFMNTRDSSNKLKDFFIYTDRLDKHRNENFEQTCPEYEKLREYL